MAGRGRELTLPAWMRQQQVEPQAPPPQVQRHDPSVYADADASRSSYSRRDAGYGRPDERHDERRDVYREERHDERRDIRRDDRRETSRRPDPRSDRRDERGGGDRRDYRDRNDRGGGDRNGDRRRRDRSRSKDRRDTKEDRGRNRPAKGEFKKMEGFGVLSLSGSGRVRVRRFDILPPGVTQETAAAYAAEVIMQAKIAALSGIVGPASFGPPTNSHMHHLSFGGSQHSRHARRLYVGGFGEISEQEIERFFNEVIDKALGEQQEHGSVISVYINRERHFAFVELKSIELTTACMELDGIAYKGQPLKIRRPNDYNPAAVKETGPIPKLDVNALGIVSTSVSDGPGKIFVGGLPYHLNEEQVKELLQAFGPLKSFHLVKELNSNLSKGYGFCEYMDPAITQIACAGLNDMQVGDKTLTVRTALSAGGLYPPMFNPNTGMSNAPGAGEPDVETVLASLQKHQQQPMQIVPTVPLGMPSRVIVLLNMVTTEDLADPEEYQDICDDIRAECEKSGSIRDMVVPRPTDHQYNPTSVCKVFIEFVDMKSAQGAANELHGRGFANRTVAVEFMDEEKFARREF